jgi:hypothetical protein
MDLQALHDELTTDPLGIGYQPHIDAGNINALRDLLNQPIIPWEQGGTFEVDDLRTYSGSLYKCRQDHTNSDPNHTPDVTPALWLQLSSDTDPYAVRRSNVPMTEVLGAVDWTGEYAALTADEKDIVQVLVSTDSLDGTQSGVTGTLESIFGAGSTTWSTLSALLDRAASRAEAVVNAPVSNDDIIQALNL